MATFPNSPTLGQTAEIGFKTYVWNGYAWSQASSQTPVTLSLGTTGPTGPAGETPTTYVETFNGITGTVDTSALTLHVAGISSDGGITASRLISTDAGSQSAGSVVVGGVHHIFSNGSSLQFAPTGFSKFTMSASEVGSFAPFKAYSTSILTGKVNTQAGISMDTAGITFPDGTYQDTASSGGGGGSSTPFVSSHTALLEFPDNKSYSLDAYTVADRTYNFLYGISVTGGCSADLVSGGTTLGSINITPSGASASFSTAVSIGSEVSVVISGVTTGAFLHDVRLVAGYTQ